MSMRLLILSAVMFSAVHSCTFSYTSTLIVLFTSSATVFPTNLGPSHSLLDVSVTIDENDEVLSAESSGIVVPRSEPSSDDATDVLEARIRGVDEDERPRLRRDAERREIEPVLRPGRQAGVVHHPGHPVPPYHRHLDSCAGLFVLVAKQ